MAAGAIRFHTGHRWDSGLGGPSSSGPTGAYRGDWSLVVPANNYAGGPPMEVVFSVPYPPGGPVGGVGDTILRTGLHVLVVGQGATPVGPVLWRSTDGGHTFAVPATPPVSPFSNMESVILAGTTQHAAVSYGNFTVEVTCRVSVSDDYGDTWTPGVVVLPGFAGTSVTAFASVYALVRDGAAVIAAGQGFVDNGMGDPTGGPTLAYSTDSGATFANPATDPWKNGGLAVGLSGAGLSYAGIGQLPSGNYSVATTEDGGATWTDRGNPFGVGPGTFIQGVYRSGSLIVLTGASSVAVSSDDGVTWSFPPIGVPNPNSVGGSGTTVIVAGYSGGGIGPSLAVSHDSGATFSNPATDPAIGGVTSSLYVQDASHLIVAARTAFPHYVAAVSDDAGATWVTSTLSVTYGLAVEGVARDGSDLAACGGSGIPSVMCSDDEGATWFAPAPDPFEGQSGMTVVLIPVLGTPAATIAAGFAFGRDSLPGWVGAWYFFEQANDDPTLYVVPAASPGAFVPTDCLMGIDPAGDPDWLQPMFSPGPWQTEPVGLDGLLINGFDTSAYNLESWDDGGGDASGLGTGFTTWSPVNYSAGGSVPGFPDASLGGADPQGADGNARHMYVLAPSPTVDFSADFEIWQMDKQFNVVNIWSIHTGLGAPYPGFAGSTPNNNLLAVDPADAFVLVWAPVDNGDGTGHIYKIDTTSGVVVHTYATPLPPGDPNFTDAFLAVGIQLGISLDGTKAYWIALDPAATPFPPEAVGIEHDLGTDTFVKLCQFNGYDLGPDGVGFTGPIDLSAYSPPPVVWDNYVDNYLDSSSPQVVGFMPAADGSFVGFAPQGPFCFGRDLHARWASPSGASTIGGADLAPTGCMARGRRSLWTAGDGVGGDYPLVRYVIDDGFSPYVGPLNPAGLGWCPIWPGPSNFVRKIPLRQRQRDDGLVSTGRVGAGQNRSRSLQASLRQGSPNTYR